MGDCAPGYICVTEADSHTPNATNLTDKAYPCPLGFYCSEGAQAPTKCPPATFTFELAAKQEQTNKVFLARLPLKPRNHKIFCIPLGPLCYNDS